MSGKESAPEKIQAILRKCDFFATCSFVYYLAFVQTISFSLQFCRLQNLSLSLCSVALITFIIHSFGQQEFTSTIFCFSSSSSSRVILLTTFSSCSCNHFKCLRIIYFLFLLYAIQYNIIYDSCIFILSVWCCCCLNKSFLFCSFKCIRLKCVFCLLLFYLYICI